MAHLFSGVSKLLQMVSVVAATLGLGLAWANVLTARRAVAHTTLVSAWRWMLSALIVWSISWAGRLRIVTISAALADHLWYASAVLAVCPLIAVLGSRRPGTRVWTWFIQFPLLCVLGWPVVSLWLQTGNVKGLQLEAPQIMAFVLVLIMGAGNYCGTRFTLAVLCYAAGCAIVAASLSVAAPAWLADREKSVLLGTLCLGLAAIFSSRLVVPPVSTDRPFDRLWMDVFDSFGIVWGRRLQDRVNFMAVKEKWSARLELHGFVWSQGDLDESSRQFTEARIEHTLRWLLRRFVDPPWIDQRLRTSMILKDVTPLVADS